MKYSALRVCITPENLDFLEKIIETTDSKEICLSEELEEINERFTINLCESGQELSAEDIVSFKYSSGTLIKSPLNIRLTFNTVNFSTYDYIIDRPIDSDMINEIKQLEESYNKYRKVIGQLIHNHKTNSFRFQKLLNYVYNNVSVYQKMHIVRYTDKRDK
jgi:hypothetical protein